MLESLSARISAPPVLDAEATLIEVEPRLCVVLHFWNRRLRAQVPTTADGSVIEPTCGWVDVSQLEDPMRRSYRRTCKLSVYQHLS